MLKQYIKFSGKIDDTEADRKDKKKAYFIIALSIVSGMVLTYLMYII